VKPFVIVAAITLAALAISDIAPPPAHAAPDLDFGPNCDTVPWGFLDSQRRTICDGPIEPGGGWGRKRSIWTPAHTTPIHTSCYGKYSVSCDTSGGNNVEMSINDQQVYHVTPDTVLPDEPGHLG
jgi:hypothetical protein